VSSLPALTLTRLPLRLFLTPRRRRSIVVAVVGLVVLAGLAAALGGYLPFVRHDASDPSGLRAAARARAVALAHARAATRVEAPHLVPPPSAPSRVAQATQANDLFATHSWYVAPPPPPPPPPAPQAAPTAPPFPYTYVGSYAPAGESPVYFLAKGDRVIDAHVGDLLDGVFRFEDAAGVQLTFNYVPLNIRQSLPTGAAP
jgi:hypothetical protein